MDLGTQTGQTSIPSSFPLETSVYTICLTVCQSGLSGEVGQEPMEKKGWCNSLAVPPRREVNNPSSSHVDHNSPHMESPCHQG